MEDDNDYESHNLIWKTQNIDSYLNKEQFNDWVAINNAHKKVLSYKFQIMQKKFPKKFSLSVAKYLQERKIK